MHLTENVKMRLQDIGANLGYFIEGIKLEFD